MRLSIHQFWNQHKKRKTPNDLHLNVIKNVKKDQHLWRDILAYWILGLCSEFGYVVIIAAAHDILHRFEVPKVWMPKGDVLNIIRKQQQKVSFNFKISPFRMMKVCKRNHRQQHTIHRQIIEIFVRHSRQVYC